MAGIGPTPKDKSRRAHRGKDIIPTTVLRFDPASQPPLPRPPKWLRAWPVVTRRWWAMWSTTAQSDHLTATDWDFLLDTALLHAQVWGQGDMKLLPELRLRVAKFGATPEDRARLRMTFAQADELDAKRPVEASSRERYGDLRVMPSATG